MRRNILSICVIFINGFDINLGLKTRYEDFYEYYLKKKHSGIIEQGIKAKPKNIGLIWRLP